MAEGDSTPELQPEPQPEPQPELGARSRRTGRLELAVLALFALAVIWLTKDGPASWADASRLATIQALGEHGTLAIDESDYFWQGDKVRFEGRYYSHQPPMLAVLGAPFYAALHHGLGLSITDPTVYRALSWLLTGLPLWLGLFALSRLLRDAGATPGWRALLLAGVAFGSLCLPYALVLNQHGAAAGLVALGFLAVQRGRPATAGAVLALAATVDLTAAFPAAALCVPLGMTHRPHPLLRYALAALPALALHFSINRAVAGDLLPFALHAEAFRWPLSPFQMMSLTGLGQGAPEGTAWVYAIGATLGDSGLFSHHPILLLYVLAGLALPFTRVPLPEDRPTPGLVRGLLQAAALGAFGIAAYYLASSRNFGGSSFGMRWFTVFAPLLALFPGAYVARRAAIGRPLRVRALGGSVLGLALAWSVAAAALGAVNPWTKFAYTWGRTPIGMVRGPEEAPTWREHLRAEWARLFAPQKFDRASYEHTYQRMLDQHRRLYLDTTAGLPPAERRAAIERGRDQLQGVVDLLDREGVLSTVRVAAHFWLGKYHAALGDRTLARREYERALALAPTYQPAQAALRQLDRGEDTDEDEDAG